MIRDFLYTPINTVKPVTDEVWIVDGPEIRFGMGPFNMSFPTRMTLIRLPGGKLVVHSPTALTPDLAQEVKALGEVADIVARIKFITGGCAIGLRRIPGPVSWPRRV